MSDHAAPQDPPTVPIPRIRDRSRRRAGAIVLAVGAVVLLVAGVLALRGLTTGRDATDAASAQPAPPSSASVPASVPPPTGAATTDATGRPLPPAVVVGAGRVLAALRANDVATLESTYLPDRGAGVAPWPVVRTRLADAALRASLAAALTHPPQPRPEVAYLFSDGDRGVGMSRAGTVAFYGIGRAARGATAPTRPDPTLGDVWGPYQRGFGDVRPPEINAGGDGTSVVDGVRWRSWGGPTATATGTASWVPPDGASSDGVQTPAIVVASDLGPCHGRTAYRTVGWYFPSKGETAVPPDTGYPNICDGP